MKFFTTFKSVAIIATIGIFLASCSHERYSNIQRGAVKSKDMVKVEKEVPSKLTDEQKELPALGEINSTPEITSNFNVEKGVKPAKTNVVIEKKFQKNTSKIFLPLKSLATTMLPFSKAKGIRSASTSNGGGGFPYWLALVCCFFWFLGLIAVGFATDWDITKLIIAFLLYCLFVIPGVIYSLIVVSKNRGSFE